MTYKIKKRNIHYLIEVFRIMFRLPLVSYFVIRA